MIDFVEHCSISPAMWNPPLDADVFKGVALIAPFLYMDPAETGCCAVSDTAKSYGIYVV